MAFAVTLKLIYDVLIMFASQIYWPWFDRSCPFPTQTFLVIYYQMTNQLKRSATTAATTAVVPATLTESIAAPDTTRHDGWTRERMIAFLEALVETASVSIAAQSVGMTRQTAYRLRARLIGQPFDHAWEAALEFGLQQLHNEALDRAMNGVPVPIFYGGEQVGERRHFNETLTRFLLDNPNARAMTRRDPHVRAAALANWNATMKRVQTGPIVWTPDERKKAQSLADSMITELEAKADPKKPQKPRQSKQQDVISEEDYQHLKKKFPWLS